MKFLLDMGISPEMSPVLRRLGHEAVHLHELGLDTLPDPAILEKAREEGAILSVTEGLIRIRMLPIG